MSPTTSELLAAIDAAWDDPPSESRRRLFAYVEHRLMALPTMRHGQHLFRYSRAAGGIVRTQVVRATHSRAMPETSEPKIRRDPRAVWFGACRAFEGANDLGISR